MREFNREDSITYLALKHLRPYLSMEEVMNIYINREGHILLDKLDGSSEAIKDENLTLKYLYRFAAMMSIGQGRQFSNFNPSSCFLIEGKHRCQVTGGKYTDSGIAVSIRLDRGRDFVLDDFIFEDEGKEKILSFVKDKKTILISAGTNTGKTSFLKALVKHIPVDERIVTVEDTKELIFPEDHYNYTQFIYSDKNTEEDLRDISNDILRHAPERIIFGELRQNNISYFLNMLDTGHPGSMATIHANSPEGAIDSIKKRLGKSRDIVDDSYHNYLSNIKKVINVVLQLHVVKEHRKKIGVRVEIVEF